MILPVILSGGAGSRLWPLSTPAVPKQFLPLMGAQTLIQETAARVAGAPFLPPCVVANAAHAAVVEAQVPGLGALILEPVGRNTAPAAAVAALHARDTGAELVLLAPADHHIGKPDAFREAVLRAAPAARDGALVTFGITPTAPETGYGYIRMGAEARDGVFRVDAFEEKPTLARARALLAQGGHAWNAGLFLFSPGAALEAFAAHAPDILECAETALNRARRGGGRIGLDADAFAACRSESFDYAVMEHTDCAACCPVAMEWSDVGAFDALWEARGKDARGNALDARAHAHGSRDCLAVSDGPRVHLLGLEGVGVVVRDGEVLVLDLARAQDVKAVKAAAEGAEGRKEQD